MHFWTAFLLGLAGSLHCAGMCGPLLLALSRSRLAGPPGISGPVLHHVGRIASYIILGALFGAMGHLAVPGGFQRWLTLGLGLILLACLIAPARFSLPGRPFGVINRLRSGMLKLLPRDSAAARLAMGALNGFLPCGLVYVAAVGAAATGSLVSGAAYMVLFGFGTWPVLLAIHFAGNRLFLPAGFSSKAITRAAIGIVAVLMILRGLDLGIPYLSPHFSKPCEHCI